jgi:hypothetical protein
MPWRNRAAVVALAGAGLVLGMPGEASAQAYRRQSATFCTPITSAYQSIRSDSGAIGNGSSSAIRLVCPILDDSHLPKDQISTIYVDAFDGSASAALDARACVSFWSSVGGSCGPASASSTSGTGMITLAPSSSVWAGFITDYGYLVINLPPISGSSVSAVKGYELFD